MSFRLDQLLKASTVRISTTGKAYEGMGFFFAPGLALTSGYVVTQAEGEMVQVFLPGEQHAVPAEIKYRFPEDVGLVILQVQTMEAIPCAYLDSDIKPGDQGYSFGCTSHAKRTYRVMMECEGMMGGAIGISHLAGRSKHLQLNGAPILNQRTGKVCGIVHAPKKGDAYRGEAVPMGAIFAEFPALGTLQKEYHCQDNRWTTLLHPDLEALNGDWSYYNRGWMRREQSIRALLFLLRTASQWALIGARMRHVFPWRSMIALIKQTFKGNLGSEIQRQYHHITRQIASQIDPHSTSQARALHRLDAQSWLISSLMEMLITPEQDYASSSRLLWMLEILQEQRVYVQTLKRMPGNFYPQLEEFKRRWKLLEHDAKYIDTSRVLSGLINRNTDTNFSLWYTIKFFLKDFILDLSQNSKLSAHGVERLFNVLVVNLRHAVPAPTASVEDLMRDLEEEVRQNPELKVLQKVQILMTSVSGEVVQGGIYRALKGSNTYHFSPKCKLYPARAQAEELARIICYDTEAEAQQHHKPCKNCLTAEKLLDRRLSDWTDGESLDAVATPIAAQARMNNVTPLPVAERPVDNLLMPDFGQATVTAMAMTTATVAAATVAAENATAANGQESGLQESGLQESGLQESELSALEQGIAESRWLESSAAESVVHTPVTERAIASAVAADAVLPATTLEAEIQLLEPLPEVGAPVMVTQTAAEPEHTIAPDTVSGEVETVIATQSAPEPEHTIDPETVAAEVEAEIATAIAAVAQDLTLDDQRQVEASEPPLLSADELLSLNTEEVDETEESPFEMAAFFVPDGDQPAIALSETAEPEVIEPTTPKKVTKKAAKKTAKPAAIAEPEVDNRPEVAEAPPAKAQSTRSSTKQTKTLKDFVAAFSSNSKTLGTAIAANQEVSLEAAAAVVPEVADTPEALIPVAAPQRRAKAAAKATSDNAKAVKIELAEVAEPPAVAEPTAQSAPKATKTRKTAAKAIATESTVATTQPEAAPAAAAAKATKSSSNKSRSGKVARLSDWAADAPVNDAPAKDSTVVPITQAKSAKGKQPQ
ncbi:MAG: hypothetical protein RLZZ511_3138 [Cyanobacteriota bacterium]|jgi:hypothetical protein